MARIYAITGAAGHLGGTLVRLLLEKGERVRALTLPGDPLAQRLPAQVERVEGDVTRPETLPPFFAHDAGDELAVLHCAGIVTIATKFDAKVHAVNVDGTRNIVQACRQYGAARLIYVSSVHAIPLLPSGETMREINDFSPDKVEGLYAKTKAEATALVLAAAREGLNASVVHPSGIGGPYDEGRGHITQLLIDYCSGGLTAGVKGGGYDFVDVRDVAQGILACVDKGRAGECYILSNRYFSIPELLGIFAEVTGRRRVRTFLPLAFAKATAGLSELYYKLLRQPPLYTRYSLYTLSGNASFSHEKADRELGYATRPMAETVKDAYDWLLAEGRIRA